MKRELSLYAPFMADLQHVLLLELPDWYIAAGYIRSYVWDRLHGYEGRERHQDIDVIYYDPADLSEERDHALEALLRRQTGNEKWSVKNQARMHIRNGDAPYSSAADAMSFWPETATAVGARLNASGALELACPYGLGDLFGMIVRRSPHFADHEYYLQRLQVKGWQQTWPLLKIVT